MTMYEIKSNFIEKWSWGPIDEKSKIGWSNGLVPLFRQQAITLTHLPRDKMAVFLQMIFSDAFSWMKSFVFWLKFHWNLFLMV